jgi:transcriptional regulator
MLVTASKDGPLVSHLPMLLEPDVGPHGRLIGHLARANRQWRESDLAQPAVAVFMGPDAYVSPNWYPSKAEHHRVVPTWNYLTVHARGSLAFHEDTEWLHDAVTRITQRHEEGRSRPWAVGDAPLDFVAAQLKGIVGVSLGIATLEGKAKLSQNRPAADQEGVRSGLAQESDTGSAAVRDLMMARDERGR